VKLPGRRPGDQNFDRQVAKFQGRIAILAGFTAPGMPITGIAGKVCPGKEKVRQPPDLCNSAVVRQRRCSIPCAAASRATAPWPG